MENLGNGEEEGEGDNWLYTYLPYSDLKGTFKFIFSRVHATLHPAFSVGRSVCRSVGRSVTFTFLSATELKIPRRL